MDKLPDEIIEVILNTASLCKKSQNFYINKYFLNISKKKINKCRKMYMLKQNICIGCHPHVLKFIKTYYSQSY